jgi:hypothetical protein
MVKKVLGWAAIAFLVFYVVRNPTGAAATARSIGAGLGSVAVSIGDFFGSLIRG